MKAPVGYAQYSQFSPVCQTNFIQEVNMGIVGTIGLIIVIYSIIKIAVAAYHLWKEKHHGE